MSRQLPVDLYRQIIDDIGEKQDLLSLCLVSRALYLEASRALYTRVHLEGHRRTSAALQTFLSASRVAELVVELTLRVGVDSAEFSDLTEQIVSTIKRMCNLTRLDLPELSNINHLDTLATSVSWGLRQGGHHFAWTRDLSLPHIKTIVLENAGHGPVRKLFGKLPYPLPRLETGHPLSIAQLDGIESVRCERVYGSRKAPLVDLKSLEVLTLATYPTNATTVMPNLNTLVCLYPGIDSFMELELLMRHFKTGCFDGLQRLGPMHGENLESIPDLSRITSLKIIVIHLPFIALCDFSASHAQRLAQKNPKLWRIGLLANATRRGEATTARIWEYHSSGSSQSESKWCSPATFRVRPREWVQTTCDLIYGIHPNRFIAQVVDIP